MWFSEVLAVLIVLNSFRINTAKYIEKNESDDKDQIIYEKYVEMDKNLKKLMNNGIKMALPLVIEANEHLNLSSRCVNNLYKLTSDIRKLKLSAIKFLDSSGKLPPGTIRGTINMLGDYDECLSTAVLLPNGAEAFHGQYCMVAVRAVLPTKKRKITLNSGMEELIEYTKNTSEVMQFLVDYSRYTYHTFVRYGLCVPSGCSVKDVNKMVNYIGEKLFVNLTVEYCDQPYEFKMNVGTIIAITSFSLAGMFLIVGSSMDYYSRKKRISFKSTISNIMVCFSVFTNFPKLINTKTQDTVLTSLFGIRTLSVFFIILLHQYVLWARFQLNGHVLFVSTQLQSFFGQVITNGFLTTDVFFFLGGLLNTYTRLKIQAEGKRQISLVQIFIHRLWRIYPTYIFTLFLFYLLSNAYGPMATFMRQEFFKHCEDRWWENLLFINNYADQSKSCMIHTWYIATDMQLFLISLFTVPVLLKNAKRGIILHVGLLVVGLISTVLWAWQKDLMPGIITRVLEVQDIERLVNAYATIFPHIAPYCTGLMTGYILSKWNHFKIPVIYRLLGWPAAASCFVAMLFMTQRWNSGVPYTAVESAFYFGFCRFLYVLAVAWMVVCCATGYGGILNYIFSLKVWIPFSRISYMVYMISFLLQLYYIASLKMLMDTDLMTMIWRHIGDIGISCLLALVLVLLVESPFISMEKIIFRSPTRKDVPANKDEHPEKAANGVEVIKEIELVNNEKNSFTK